MRLKQVLSIADLERIAIRRLPSSIFSFLAGGSEDEITLKENRFAFDKWALLPRALVDVSKRSQEVELFGQRYSSPIGIAPMGGGAVFRYKADLALARAASLAGVPFILSGASTVPLEHISEVAPDSWYQAYIPSNRTLIKLLLNRIHASGFKKLVVTIDVPIAANREKEIRNGFSIPLRLSGRLITGGLSHPRWLIETFGQTMFRSGVPHFENYSATRGGPIISGMPGNHREGRDALSWADIQWIRDEWKGILVVKGILRVEDACTAESIGIDGIILSNHGGRQLDHSISPLDVLPSVIKATTNIVVMIDSGFRRGTDVLKAIALGAKFIFLGRPAMYGVAVAGERGVQHALSIIKREIDQNLALMGCPDISSFNQDFLCLREPISDLSHHIGRR